MATNKLEKQIEALTHIVQRLADNPVAVVAPVAPVAPVLPVISPMHSGDHDILTSFVASTTVSMATLEKKVDAVSDKLDNSFTSKEETKVILEVQKDHENRIRNNEEATQDQKTINGNVNTKIGIYSTIAALIITTAVTLALAAIKKAFGL